MRRNNLKQSREGDVRNKNNRLVFNAISYIPYRLYFSKANLLNFNTYSTNSICADIFTEMADSDSIDMGKSRVNL